MENLIGFKIAAVKFSTEAMIINKMIVKSKKFQKKSRVRKRQLNLKYFRVTTPIYSINIL